MSATLLWDAGPGEVRAGLVEASRLVELRILRLPSDPAPLAAGDVCTARVMRNLGRNKAQVALGSGQEAIVQPAKGLVEGALLAVEITRPPIPEPGRWKPAMARPAQSVAPLSEPGRHDGNGILARFLRQQTAAGLTAIVCPDAASLNALRDELGADAPPMRIDPQAIAEADLDELIEAAITGEFPITEGALSIERTRAMTMIDVDGGGDPLALNIAAAREIGRLLRLLDIGGPVGIDFVTLDDRKARAAVDSALDTACAALGPHKRTVMNGFGFVQLIRPRSGPSIPEVLCGITPGRLSAESRALALLREAGRTQGHGPRTLVAQPAVINLIRQWPAQILVLQSALGTSLELVADPAAIGYGHVHVSQS